MSVRRLVCCLILILEGLTAMALTPEAQFTRAEALRAEKSHRLAREAYQQLLTTPNLPTALREAASVWAADTAWRENAHADTATSAGQRLAQLARELTSPRWRAEAAGSLADFYRVLNPWDVEQLIYPTLLAAKNWEAAETDEARRRAVETLLELAEVLVERGGILPEVPPEISALNYLSLPPPDRQEADHNLLHAVLERALKLAGNDVELTAHATLLRGWQRMRLATWGGTDELARRSKEFGDGAEADFKQVAVLLPTGPLPVRAQALLAQFYDQRQKFRAAAELKPKIETAASTLAPGDIAALNALAEYRSLFERITGPAANLAVGAAFAPQSYIHMEFSGRNLAQAEVVIEQLDPAALLATAAAKTQLRDANEFLNTSPGREVARVAIPGLALDGEHRPEQASLNLEPLKPGYYRARLLAQVPAEMVRPANFLVSRLAWATITDTTTTRIWITDAETGAPAAQAAVSLLQRYRQPTASGVQFTNAMFTGKSDARGMVTLKPGDPPANCQPENAYIHISHGDDVVFAPIGSVIQPYWYLRKQANTSRQAVIYAFAAKPAYRPGEKVQWKAIVRFQTDEGYQLPETKTIWATVRDQSGNLLSEGPLPVSEFGSIHGAFSTTATTALGMLALELRNGQNGDHIFNTALARLEEYKLPEYIVNVTPAPGQRRLGDSVPVEISAEYYFGGPVAGATAKIKIERAPFWPQWSWWPYPWLDRPELDEPAYFGMARHAWPRYQPAETVLERELQLDGAGRARLDIPPATAEHLKQAEQQNYWGDAYTITAEVTDASRRMVAGSGTVRLARTGFAAFLNPEALVYLPGDPVKLELKTLDPNDQPLSAEGRATLAKAVWNPTRHNDQGTTEPGYDYLEVAALAVGTTRAEGRGQFEMTAREPGFYRVLFTAFDAFGSTVTAETMVHVAAANSALTGYRSGGVEVIPDKAVYKRGDTAEVLLVTRRANVDVLFAAEGQGLIRDELVRMGGAAKGLAAATSQLVRVPIGPEAEPGITFSALAMYDWSGFQARRSVPVPPLPRYLNVEISTSKPEFRPGETTPVEIRVTDWNNNPVQTELSLAVADAAIWAIQPDLVGDIRKMFWNTYQNPIPRQIFMYSNAYAIERWRKKAGTDEYEAAARDEADQGAARRENMMFKGARAGDMAYPAAVMVTDAAAPPSAMGMLAEGTPVAMQNARADAPAQPPRLRTNFSSSALWLPQIVTDAAGHATAELKLPDSLTTWKTSGVAADGETRVGQARIEIKTNQPLMLRPQGPRFLVQGDVAAFSAVVNNATSEANQVDLSLALTHAQLAGAGTLRKLLESTTAGLRLDAPEGTLNVPAQGQRRADWLLTADAPGTFSVRITAAAGELGDAVEKQYPIQEYGAEQLLAAGATLRGNANELTETLKFELPAWRRAGSERLTVWLEPTLARTMVNALPYLAQYPYGCTEQTLSRFVPAVITLKTLRQLGLRRPELEAEVPKMVQAGLERLLSMQHANGAWGWWQEGPDDIWMTAYAVASLAEARAADVAVDPAALQRAMAWLQAQLLDQAGPSKSPGRPQGPLTSDLTAFVLYALAQAGDSRPAAATQSAYERVWAERDKLNPYTRALYTLACHRTGQPEKTAVLLRNLHNGLIEDKANGTAHWGEAGIYYHWSEGGVEATAFTLRTLLAIDAQNELIEPAINWLVRNRKGARWTNTRDTAMVVLALADAVRLRREDSPDLTAELRLNGAVVQTLQINSKTMWETPIQYELDPAQLRSGINELVITRRGKGTLYATAGVRFFNQAETIKPAGHELFVDRQYLVERGGTWRALNAGELLTSRERVRVRLKLESKNNYEYVLLEDPKPAGLEPVELQSGYRWQGKLGYQHEIRDNRNALFFDRLPEGQHEIVYELRAEVPGRFSALPSQIEAMYVPELRGNGASERLNIRDQATQ